MGYIYMKESTDERQTKTSKSGVSSSDLAVEDDDERGVKNDGRLGRRHGSDDSTRRTSVEAFLAQKGNLDRTSLFGLLPWRSEFIIPSALCPVSGILLFHSRWALSYARVVQEVRIHRIGEPSLTKLEDSHAHVVCLPAVSTYTCRPFLWLNFFTLPVDCSELLSNLSLALESQVATQLNSQVARVASRHPGLPVCRPRDPHPFLHGSASVAFGSQVAVQARPTFSR